MRCLTKYNGFFRAVVVFEFTKEPGESFSIGRSVAAIAQSQLAKELGPSSSFEPYQANLQRPVTVITEEGVPPSRYVVGLPAAIPHGGPWLFPWLGQGSAHRDPAFQHLGCL